MNVLLVQVAYKGRGKYLKHLIRKMCVLLVSILSLAVFQNIYTFIKRIMMLHHNDDTISKFYKNMLGVTDDNIAEA